MEAHKLQVKIFAVSGAVASPESFVPVFHRWIKERVLSELVIDVANYTHVPKGPGVVLIGHAGDTFIEEGDGRFGLLHSRKRAAPAPGERLIEAFRHALHAAVLLEKEPSLGSASSAEGKLRFSPNEFLFRINDRLLAPNTDATFATVKDELDRLAGLLFDGGAYELTRVGDAKALFSVRIVSPAVTTLDAQLARLGGPPAPDGAVKL